MNELKIHRMKQSDAFRKNAENCRHLVERAINEPLDKRYWRMAEAWIALAEEQDWLDGEKAPVFQRLDGMSTSRPNLSISDIGRLEVSSQMRAFSQTLDETNRTKNPRRPIRDDVAIFK